MRKLKMAIEELKVTSFETEAKDGQGGTVAAHGFSGFTCPACPSVFMRCPTLLTRDCCTP